MSFSNEHIGGGADGGIFNFYVDLPEHMDHDEVSKLLLEVDANVQGITEPPVAKVFNDSLTPENEPIEDYRKFYVEFESNATEEDVIAAVRIVAGAIKKVRYADPEQES